MARERRNGGSLNLGQINGGNPKISGRDRRISKKNYLQLGNHLSTLNPEGGRNAASSQSSASGIRQ